MKRIVATAIVALVGALVSTGAPALAQSYPTKPLRFIVPYPPGGNTDIVARPIAQKLSEQLGQPVVIDNRGGAATVLGSELAAKAAPDGYTFILSTTSHAINATLYRKLSFDPITDFVPIGYIGIVPNILVVHPSVPAKSVKEFIEIAKSKPGKINYSSAGNGATNHVGMELLKTLTGIDVVHVPYKGTAAAVADLLGGQVSVMFDAVPSAMPHIKAGKTRALGIGSTRRIALLPDLPTIIEAGVPGFESGAWMGLQAPAGTPREIVTRLNAELGKALASPDVRDRLTGLGMELRPGTPEEFAAFIKSEMVRWGKVVKDSGARVD